MLHGSPKLPDLAERRPACIGEKEEAGRCEDAVWPPRGAFRALPDDVDSTDASMARLADLLEQFIDEPPTVRPGSSNRSHGEVEVPATVRSISRPPQLFRHGTATATRPSNLDVWTHQYTKIDAQWKQGVALCEEDFERLWWHLDSGWTV